MIIVRFYLVVLRVTLTMERNLSGSQLLLYNLTGCVTIEEPSVY